MQRVFLVKACVILTAAVLITLAGNVLAHSGELAEGEGSYLLGPGLPTVFTFDSGSMSCAVAWGTMGAPGPGPFSDVEMGLEEVNFGMLVYSVEVASFVVDGNRVHMTGKARSITTVNEEIVENAIYRFEVEAIDGGSPEQDSFGMTLHEEGAMFDGHTFAPAEGAGLIGGDVVVRSQEG